jgi:hypothetical protein
MAQFVRTRVRCAVFPAKVSIPFQSQEGATPKIFKGAGCEFELCFFVDASTLFDVGNISSLTLMAKAAGQPGSAPVMSKTTVAIVNIAEIGTWQDGTEQHVVIVFSAIETNVAAGMYDLTLYGLTTDDGIDTDVFGTSKLEIIDAGLTNTVAAPVGPAPAVTTDQLAGVLKQFVKKVMDPGDTLTARSKNGRVARIWGVLDDETRVDDLEDT